VRTADWKASHIRVLQDPIECVLRGGLVWLPSNCSHNTKTPSNTGSLFSCKSSGTIFSHFASTRLGAPDGFITIHSSSASRPCSPRRSANQPVRDRKLIRINVIWDPVLGLPCGLKQPKQGSRKQARTGGHDNDAASGVIAFPCLPTRSDPQVPGPGTRWTLSLLPPPKYSSGLDHC